MSAIVRSTRSTLVGVHGLNALMRDVIGTRFALMVSRDGLPLNYTGIDEVRAAHLAAVTSAMCGAAAAYQRDVPAVGIDCIDHNLYIYVSSKVCLLVGADKTSNVDDIAAHMQRLTRPAIVTA